MLKVTFPLQTKRDGRVSGQIFELGLPEELIDLLLIKAAGKRLRLPPLESGHNPRFKAQRDKSICQRYLAGETAEELAKDTRISVSRVKKILASNGIRKQEENQKSLEERIRVALMMKTPVTEIAKREGRSRQWIYQVMREKNLK